MEFTEHEMTQAVHGAAKRALTAAAAAQDVEVFDADTELASMGTYPRYKFLDQFGDLVLPVLVALPDVDVAPGTRPAFTIEQIAETVEQVTLAEAERKGIDRTPEQYGDYLALRLATVADALDSLPARINEAALVGAGATDGLDGLDVPDTLEGLI